MVSVEKMDKAVKQYCLDMQCGVVPHIRMSWLAGDYCVKEGDYGGCTGACANGQIIVKHKLRDGIGEENPSSMVSEHYGVDMEALINHTIGLNDDITTKYSLTEIAEKAWKYYVDELRPTTSELPVQEAAAKTLCPETT